MIIMLLAHAMTFAATVDGLYSAKVEVPNRDKKHFEKGLRSALIVVLAKNSSNSEAEIRVNPQMAAELERGHKYVEQFSYQSMDEDGDNPRLLLKASFPESVINDFLQRGGLSLWPANRPETLLIPVMKINGTLSLNNFQVRQQYNLDGLFKDAAYKYGLALAPAKTQRSVPSKSLRAYWNWDVASINKATANLPHDAVFTGRIAITSGGVRGGWMLTQGGKKYSVDIQAKSMAQFVDRGFAWLAKLWAKQYAVNLQLGGNEQLLMVKGVSSHKQFTQLMTYLNKLDIVDHVYMLQLEPDLLTMAVGLKADAEQFERTLKRSRHLKASSAGDASSIYIWQ